MYVYSHYLIGQLFAIRGGYDPILSHRGERAPNKLSNYGQLDYAGLEVRQLYPFTRILQVYLVYCTTYRYMSYTA